eukprot:TRINITY_DN1351_c0_g1_i4.p1 TRINITY_DN1351_c0_g1~~TRINITY_DN1351_c0_g1_i4.p1  ORF type:complete len:907 (+),score=159.46 TRINITY_DN1351_c0_g1_i4:228-2723(+)
MERDIQDGQNTILVQVDKERQFFAENPKYTKWCLSGKQGKAPLKNIKINLHNIWPNGEKGPPPDIVPDTVTTTGLPQVNGKVLAKFAGNEDAALEALRELDPYNHLLFDCEKVIADENEKTEREKISELKQILSEFETRLYFSNDAEQESKSKKELQSEDKYLLMEQFARQHGFGLIFGLMPGLKQGLEACIAIDDLLHKEDEQRADRFLNWLEQYYLDDSYSQVKLTSSQHLRVLFFGGSRNVPYSLQNKVATIHNIWSKDSLQCPLQLQRLVDILGGKASVNLSTLIKLSGDVCKAKTLLKVLQQTPQTRIVKNYSQKTRIQLNNLLLSQVNDFLPNEQIQRTIDNFLGSVSENENSRHFGFYQCPIARVFSNPQLDQSNIDCCSFSNNPSLQNSPTQVRQKLYPPQRLLRHRQLKQFKDVPGKFQFLHELAINDDGSIRDQNEESSKTLSEVGAQYGFGKVFPHMGGVIPGLEACAAIGALVKVATIEKLISGFLIPLQSDNISTQQFVGSSVSHRIHSSLNLRTETGRLSCRLPNLQNQPALEKDKYKIRKAFCAERGKKLVVADYGQLELRVLAHIANCESMLDAFEQGGDFHSRTAADMYDYIKEEIKSGKVLLEKGDWKGKEGEEMPPLVKNKYASERRKAKVLNFSIAYGKTAWGLAKDWGTSLEEAEETLNKWYESRKEVKKWQELRHKQGFKEGYVSTMMGRQRNLPNMVDKKPNDKGVRGDMRKAINTPVQGSAADIVMAAMIRIVKNKELKEMGWKLLLQIHDEVILEGPAETAEEAKDIVVKCMEYPFYDENTEQYRNPMLVELKVDASIADNWYEGK